MTHFSSKDVRYLAQLSSVELEADEAKDLEIDLEHIVGFFEQLSELDTEGVEPTYQVTDVQNVWREDETVDTYGVEQSTLLELAPEAEANSIKVPKVL
jgi:aspartyl-tRNA(Asn)/glutamyl-tRNA(Gln) amidotransferase subunit C